MLKVIRIRLGECLCSLSSLLFVY